MKFITMFLCGLAGIATVRAEQFENDQFHKGRQAQASAPVQVAAPKVRNVPNARFNGNRNLSRAPLSLSPNIHGNGNAGVNGNLRLRGNGQGLGQQRQQFKLNAVPNPKIASARFNANNRIVGSERWQGQNYSAFRSYHAQWHDRGWWRNHHTRIILIGGGWYYWDTGFWYPAWGYDAACSYYPYDGPIYAYNDLPPDQVIADVQSALQEQGYYTGEVDGLLGPLTRAALADYQRDHGLYTTAAIDQPTLASLGMG